MQKTKLGISVGLLGAALYFMGLFSGYIVTVLLAGYVLLCEDNEWLKKAAVKVVSVMALFSFVSVVINLIPNTFGVISNIVTLSGGSFHVAYISNIINVFESIFNLIEKVLLLILALKALKQETISVPIVDGLIKKYMD